jgi:hypothetical protein
MNADLLAFAKAIRLGGFSQKKETPHDEAIEGRLIEMIGI